MARRNKSALREIYEAEPFRQELIVNLHSLNTAQSIFLAQLEKTASNGHRQFFEEVETKQPVKPLESERTRKFFHFCFPKF